MAGERRIDRRRVVQAGAGMVGAALAAGGGSGVAASRGAPSSRFRAAYQTEPVEITWSTTPLWPLGANNDNPTAPPEEWALDAIARYREIEPNVTITLELVPFSDWQQKYVTALASQSWPNIMYRIIDWGGMLQLVDEGIVVPFNDVITPEDREDISETWWEPYSLDGQVYEFPIFGDPAYIAINRTMFEAVGALDLLPDEQTREWDWDQFLAAAQAVTGGSGAEQTYGFALPGDEEQYWTMGWVPQSFGGQVWTEDESLCIMDAPDFIEGVQFEVAMQDEHQVIPPGLPSSSDKSQFFLDKRVAMVHQRGGVLQTIATGLESGVIQAPFDTYLVNQPYQTGVPSRVGHSGETLGYSVMRDEDDRKVAASKAFVRWLGLAENKAGWTQRAFMPARASARDGAYANDPNLSWASEVLLQKPFEKNPARLHKNPVTNRVMTWSYFQEVLGGAFQEAMFGMKSPEQALTDATTRINNDLAEAAESS